MITVFLDSWCLFSLFCFFRKELTIRSPHGKKSRRFLIILIKEIAQKRTVSTNFTKKICKKLRISEAVSDIINQQKGTFPFPPSATSETLAFLTTEMIRNLTSPMLFYRINLLFQKKPQFLTYRKRLKFNFLIGK